MTIKEIKQQFFTYRNGIVADTLRKAGDSHKIIFGLNIPQISDIAKTTGVDSSLATELWNDSHVRESQMLAPYIWDVNALTTEQAIALTTQVNDCEIADILCMRLLRRHNSAVTIMKTLLDSQSAMLEYIGLRLARNLIAVNCINSFSYDRTPLLPSSVRLLADIRQELEFLS